MHRRTFLATGLAALATLRSDARLESRSSYELQSRTRLQPVENVIAALVRKRAQELSLRAFEPPR